MSMKKKFQNKLLVTFLTIIFLGGVIFLMAQKNNKPTISKSPPLSTSVKNVKQLSPELAKKDFEIIESNKIYDIGSTEPIITAIIIDKTTLETKYPFLKRAYKGDLIITTPTQTVIFDTSTKTVRDISKISLYDELSKIK